MKAIACRECGEQVHPLDRSECPHTHSLVEVADRLMAMYEPGVKS